MLSPIVVYTSCLIMEAIPTRVIIKLWPGAQNTNIRRYTGLQTFNKFSIGYKKDKKWDNLTLSVQLTVQASKFSKESKLQTQKQARYHI